jgi:asparagine synthase (glutamine-hydrolysing)
MCGIAGAINFKLSYREINKSMLHRGPDEQHGFAVDNVDMYHLRLSIIDITSGKQPMHLDDRFTIIFNGEIYNYKELKDTHNLPAKTSSDTEILLLLYKKYGVELLQYLDGMFAFAIYDTQEKKLFIARDRAGKKPLYYYTDKEKIVFASELNCLKSLLPLQMDNDNFYHYFRLGSFYGNLTPYKNVTELKGGSFVLIDCITLTIKEKRWWNITDQYQNPNKDNFSESLEKVDAYLHTAIKNRVQASDLEVGSFLSGGIDSGLVTAIASEYSTKLKTFTVAFNGAYNEAPLAKLVANKYSTEHTEINISFNSLKNDIEKILSNYGEPFFDSSAIPSYYVSAEAKKHLTVILNGDGADELFGGYRRYVPFAKYDFFKKNNTVKNTAVFAKKILPVSNNKRSAYNYLYRLVSLAAKNEVNTYLSAGVDIIEDYENNIIHPPANYMQAIQNDFDKISDSTMSGLQKIMNMDFDTTLFSDLLVKMDIANMAHSVEGRSPFLCKDLVEYTPRMADEFKIHGNTTKYLLRQLSKKYLPVELVDQPKRGFEVPLKNWVDNELKDIINDHLSTDSSLTKQFVQRKFIADLLKNKVNMSAEKRAKILWNWLSLEIWYKKVYLQ